MKNTDWIIGMVVYTGHETKIMKNSCKSRTKFSLLETQTNKQIIFIFIFQILICLLCSSFSQMWTLKVGLKNDVYLKLIDDSKEQVSVVQAIFIEGLTRFGTWMLLFA